jgi:virginiamycin B lyase
MTSTTALRRWAARGAAAVVTAAALAAGSQAAAAGAAQASARPASVGHVTSYGNVSKPWGMVQGPDGALWFNNYGNNSIGRITTTGTVTNYTDPSIDGPEGITAGPDGALWFTNYSGFPGAGIGRTTTQGALSHHSGPTTFRALGIAAGPDANLWFTNPGANSIGRITDQPATTLTLSPSSGSPAAVVKVSGAGFGAFEYVRISVNGTVVATVKTGATGKLSTRVTIPSTATGSQQITAKGLTSKVSASTVFTVS